MRIFLTVIALALATVPASPHGWYPEICCNGSDEGGDCHPVPCDSITETRTGASWGGIQFSREQIHPTQDKNCHVCVGHYSNPERDVPHCVFVQPST